jgi:putative dehydrogenase
MFNSSGIFYVDCPVSGGPARARDGDLTLIASGDTESLDKAKLVLDALAREVHVIKGGAGGGSTVKCVHQLLAGVHICAAAEAMGKRRDFLHWLQMTDLTLHIYSHGSQSWY